MECPQQLDKMLDIARELSRNFIFCRIDLYNFKDRIYFGEITIHPGGGQEPLFSYDQEVEFGKMINVSTI